jgi:hypothetical protein
MRLRYPLMGLSVLMLVAGMWAGLVRLGWSLPHTGYLPGAHGALMVGGFLGTLIGLERAVAVRRSWAYLAPALSGLGGAALVLLLGLGWPLWLAGPVLITLGSMVLVIVYVSVLRIQFTLFTATMALGALVWACGNLLWLLWLPIYQTVLWWAGFLVLTIVGERLELTRMLPRSTASNPLFVFSTAIFLGGLVLSVPAHDAGARLMGVGLICFAGWLARYDIARRTVRQSGMTRYIAVGLLAGYIWLFISGVFYLLYGGVAAGPRYDSLLHSMFLGFVFSMIFAHAPIILPAITGLTVPFRAVFYAHLALLHASVALRVAGDLLSWVAGRQWGGLLNVVALLVFMANTALAVISYYRTPRKARTLHEHTGIQAPAHRQ